MSASTEQYARKGTVYLVGAGPGDAELLTLKAARLLASADVVLHDDLVPTPVLAMAGRQALLTSVGKRCGQARITQSGIHALMIDCARRGLSVVRLKCGDPLIFGRAGEELQALRAAGIEFEVVPGVTAAVAAAASVGLSLTDRRFASKIIFASGHHAAEKEQTAPIFTEAPPADATLLIYMPGRDFTALAAELLGHGLAAETACCCISHAACPEQVVAATTLGELAELVPGPAPVVLMIGRAMEGARTTDCSLREPVAQEQRSWDEAIRAAVCAAELE
jgi:uroporphyrin-III C-methyltransferase